MRILLGICGFVFWVFWIASWGSDLSQQVTVKELNQPNNGGNTFAVVGSAGADTSMFFSPWTYTGLVFNATGDSVDVWVVVECGNDTTLSREDSLRVVGEQKVVWMLDLPISQRARAFFLAASSNNGSGTEITNTQYDRQW